MSLKGSLLGMGNPLLDISATVDKELLDRYEFKANDAILYDKEDIYEELVDKCDVEYTAGGATQNSMRVAQWILSEPQTTAFFGCVGKDKTADTLARCAKEAGVDVRYQINEDKPTGKCAVLITDLNRSLVTKLDAANHFTVEHLEPNWSAVESAKCYYSSGFFLTVSPESMLKVAKYAAENGKTFAINLSAPFLPAFFLDPMLKVLAYSELLFGNESEAEAFSEKMDYGTKDIKEIALKIAQIPLESPGKSRTVVITQGAEPVVVVRNGELKEYPVPPLSKEEIVDTNGAGDAFVGGYLAQLVLGKDLDTCIRCGNWAAAVIIKRSGCTCPQNMDFQ